MAVLLAPEEGFVFSFLRSEKFGTDAAMGFSDCALRLPELEFESLDDDLGAGAAFVRAIDDDKFLLGKGFFVWLGLEAPSPEDPSLRNLS